MFNKWSFKDTTKIFDGDLFSSNGFAGGQRIKQVLTQYWILSGQTPGPFKLGVWTLDGVWLGASVWLG